MSAVPERPDSAEASEDRASQLVAVFIVLGTLSAAIVGFLFAAASRSGDAAGVLAQRRAIEAAATEQRSQQWTSLQYQLYAQSALESRRAAGAHVAGLFAGGSRARTFEEQRWKAVSGRTAELSDALGTQFTGQRLAGTKGPDEDPAFPARFLASSTRESTVRQGLEDAANEVNSAWSGRTAVYTAILTLLAVSLYLLGFSLTLGEQPRRWISATGMVFVVIGSAWALSVAVTHPRSPPNEAAQRFADGTLALSTAWDRYDNSGYKKAERDFDRAIALRPSYAQAYAKRANATYIAASPQRATYMSVTTPAALQRAIDDQERAIRLGLSNARIQGSLGFDLFQLALQKQEPRLLAESIRQTGQAIAAAPALDYLRYNLGVALLADDRVEESRKAYQDAVEHTAYDDEDLVAGALTDLELVRRYLPKLAPQVQQMKGSIVGSVLTGHPGPHHSDATITGTKAHMFTAAVQVEQMQLKDVASDDVISLQWYYNDTQHHGWFVLPDVSGLVTTSSKQGEDLLTDGTDGYFNQRSHLRETTPPQCLAEGEYRVEVYVGGDLKDTAEADWKVPSMQPSVLQSLNTAMCHPSDWVGDERVPGVLQGFHSPDGSRGAYFFEFSLPRGITKRQLTTFPETSVNFAVSSFTTLFPHSPKPYGDSGSAYFMGLDGGTYRYFSYHGGYVLVTAGYDPREAIMIVGIAFGPKDDFPGGISYLVDDSFTRYQPLP